MQHIGVFNTAFLGDAILTLPLLQSLKIAYPDACIDYYVRGGVALLFEHHPAISRVITYDKRGKEKGVFGALRMCEQLRKEQYSLWLSPHTSLRSSFLAKATQAPIRIGYVQATCANFCYTHTVERQFGNKHEIERILGLLHPLGIEAGSHWPDVHVPEYALEEAKSFFGVDSPPILGIHPGSAWATKCWPVAYCAQIACEAMNIGRKVVVFGASNELDKTEAIEQIVREKMGNSSVSQLFINLGGKLNLVQLAAHIAQMSVYLSNDTGPMHLAWSLHVPTIALLGPTESSLGFTPLGEAGQVLEVSLPCRPCGLHGAVACPQKHHLCMKSLTPPMVWERILPYLVVE